VAEDGWHQPEIRDFWNQFHASKQVRVYSAGSLIFEQGAVALGVYLIQRGSVQIRCGGATGGQVLAPAGPGAVLGLSECIAGASHPVKAEAACCVEIAFLERRRFLNYLREHPSICMQIVRLLSEDLHALYHEFRFAERRPRRTNLRSDDCG
jgi:CRP-like cAMP-binding protein